MRTVLLAHQPVQGRSADYYYVAPELRGLVHQHLKQVIVYLVDDDVNRHAFLWLMPDTEHSPYRSAVLRVLAKGQDFAAGHLFRFGKAVLGKPLDVRFKERGQGSPGPTLPSRPLSQLLPEALGPDRLIRTTAHPVYIDLVEGRAES